MRKPCLDYRKYTRADVYFVTLENQDASSSLKQHGYVDRYPGTEDKGNLSLCGRFHGWDGGDGPNNANELNTPEPLSKYCCKNCLRIFNTLERSK